MSAMPGVHHAQANSASASITVHYDASATSEEALRQAVLECGYHCSGKLWGLIAIADATWPTSAAAVAAPRERGVEVVMLTGDNRATAERVGKELGVSMHHQSGSGGDRHVGQLAARRRQRAAPQARDHPGAEVTASLETVIHGPRAASHLVDPNQIPQPGR